MISPAPYQVMLLGAQDVEDVPAVGLGVAEVVLRRHVDRSGPGDRHQPRVDPDRDEAARRAVDVERIDHRQLGLGDRHRSAAAAVAGSDDEAARSPIDEQERARRRRRRVLWVMSRTMAAQARRRYGSRVRFRPDPLCRAVAYGIEMRDRPAPARTTPCYGRTSRGTLWDHGPDQFTGPARRRRWRRRDEPMRHGAAIC